MQLNRSGAKAVSQDCYTVVSGQKVRRLTDRQRQLFHDHIDKVLDIGEHGPKIEIWWRPQVRHPR